MRPPRKVPTVSTTPRARNSMPLAVTQPTDAPALAAQVGDLLLEQPQIRLVLEQPADRAPVELAVGLGAGGAHRRPLAGIQGAELDAGLVGGERHGAAQRVDLLDQVPLADAADRGIAAHLARGSRCSA